MKEQMTYHVSVQRADRVKHIIEDIGLGQIVKEKYTRFSLEQAGRWVCITDTGITIVKDEAKEKVITMYVTTQRELVAVFGGTKKVPIFLKKKVAHNESKYTERGKTIWK
jgi:methyl coenzyme M reductase subunit C-like uncharacterized protein (methanogenesis marker protein 7)